MANAMTEHSKKLRARTANERNKRLLEQGLVARIGVQVPKKTAEQFDEIAEKLGLSRPKAFEVMCEAFLKTL